MNIGVGMRKRIEGALETEDPENGDVRADRYAWLPLFEGGQSVAVDTGLCSDFRHRKAAPDSSQSDAVTQLPQTLGSVERKLAKIAHFCGP